MNVWVDSRRTLALQGAADYLGSALQQLYLSMNHLTTPANTMARDSLGLPEFIEDRYYEGNATLRMALEPSLNSSKVLDIKLTLASVGTTATTSIVLGSNTIWQESTFMSNSPCACITAFKFPNRTISLRFGG